MDFLKRQAYIKSVEFNAILKLVIFAKRYFKPKFGLSLTMRHTHKI